MVHVLHYLYGPTLYLMTVSLIQWRAVIGIFNCSYVGVSKTCNLSKNVTSVMEIALLCYDYFESAYILLLTFVYIFFLFYIAMVI